MRSQKVDTFSVILCGDLGCANGTRRSARERERARVLRFWPDDLLRRMAEEHAPWRLLVDPTYWPDERDRVIEYVAGFRSDRGRWPTVDDARRMFGRVSNHRGSDENPCQPNLFP